MNLKDIFFKKKAGGDNQEDWVSVKGYNSRMEAETSSVRLKEYGINFQVVSDDKASASPFPFKLKSGAEIRVLKADYEKASKLLNNI